MDELMMAGDDERTPPPRERSTNFLPAHTIPVCLLNLFRSGPGPLSVVCTHRDELLHLRCALPMARGIRRSSPVDGPVEEPLEGEPGKSSDFK